jgi:crotonobetainyl-CoA:carnitine CoA-transferase CaiB-like acyl-CoA transferase
MPNGENHTEGAMDNRDNNGVTAPAGALSRFTVLDLTRVRSGPTAVRQLADWGARVIKIEPPETEDGAEPMGGPRSGSDFQNLQRNRRSLTLDLKQPDGIAILRRLVEGADVLVENFRPDVKFRLGIDYAAMQAINPRLVYASISGFGQTGPYRERPGFDQIAQGMGGLLSITGQPGQGPMRVGIPVADLTAGIFCAQGVLVALLEREVSGLGQWVQVSLLESQIFMLDFQAARWLNEGQVAGQAGNNHPTTVPTGVFRTKDGAINIASAGGEIWRRLCKAIGAEALAADPRFATIASRSAHRDTLNALIEEHLAASDSAVWIERLNAAGVPCGPIHAIDQVFADPQVQALGMVETIPAAAPDRRLHLLRQPMSLSRTPSTITRRPPERGEHSDEILAEFGYDEATIAGFRARGAV